MDKGSVRTLDLNNSKRGLLVKANPNVKYRFFSTGKEKRVYLRLNLLKVYFEGNTPGSITNILEKSKSGKSKIINSLISVYHTLLNPTHISPRENSQMIKLLS